MTSSISPKQPSISISKVKRHISLFFFCTLHKGVPTIILNYLLYLFSCRCSKTILPCSRNPFFFGSCSMFTEGIHKLSNMYYF
jgi:hypothetical protein